ncbi:MAG TPA: hypothetical protein VIM84_15925 [Gemmatimonadales bacterium]
MTPLLLVLVFALLLVAQSSNVVIIPFTGTPTGTCGSTMLAVNQATGMLYGCNGGAWTAAGIAPGNSGNTPAASRGLNGIATEAPATAAAACTKADIAFDTGYIYVCVAKNTRKRASLATWK